MHPVWKYDPFFLSPFVLQEKDCKDFSLPSEVGLLSRKNQSLLFYQDFDFFPLSVLSNNFSSKNL